MSSPINTQHTITYKSKTLIVLCCHAIYIGPSASQPPAEPVAFTESPALQSQNLLPINPDSSTDPRAHPIYNPQNWLLAPFQDPIVEIPTFIDHTRAALTRLINALSRGEDAYLVISGAPTKPRLTSQSEAQSYLNVTRWLLADDTVDGLEDLRKEDLKASSVEVHDRVLLEEYATDSFQNVLLACLRWCVEIGKYGTTDGMGRADDGMFSGGADDDLIRRRFFSLPERLVVVGHEFKRARFMDLHAPALRRIWPAECEEEGGGMEVECVGIDPAFSVEEREKVEESERRNGYDLWREDEFGCMNGGELVRKKCGRGWTEKGYLRWFEGELKDMGMRDGSMAGFASEVRRMVRGRMRGR